MSGFLIGLLAVFVGGVAALILFTGPQCPHNPPGPFYDDCEECRAKR